MSGKISVTVICGALGSGKSSLINRLLQGDAAADQSMADIRQSVVIVSEAGERAVDHSRVLMVKDDFAVVEGACSCCAVGGELVTAMRELFMQALRKESPPFSQVIIETSGLADPAPIMTTLRYDRFLAERYAYASGICVVDASRDAASLLASPQAVQQVVMADTLVLSKAEGASAARIAELRSSLGYVNPDAPTYDMNDLPETAMLLKPVRRRPELHPSPGGSSLWAGRTMTHWHPSHAGIHVVTLKWREPLVRSHFTQVMQALQDDDNLNLLRIKASLYFRGQDGISDFQGFHQQLFPTDLSDSQPVNTADSAEIPGPRTGDAKNPALQESVLVFVYRGTISTQLVDLFGAMLPGASTPLSPARNFVQ